MQYHILFHKLFPICHGDFLQICVLVLKPARLVIHFDLYQYNSLQRLGYKQSLLFDKVHFASQKKINESIYFFNDFPLCHVSDLHKHQLLYSLYKDL